MNTSEQFLRQLKTKPPTTKEEWFAYVRDALAYAHSPDRHIIAERLVHYGALCFARLAKQQTKKVDALAAFHDPEAQPVMDALAELEIPDYHIAPGYMDDYTPEEAEAYARFANVYVSYKWRKLLELLPPV